MKKPVTIQELFNKIPSEKIQFQLINNAVMSADRGSKKKSPSIQIGVAEEVAANFLTFGKRQKVGILIMVDADDFEKARSEVLD